MIKMINSYLVAQYFIITPSKSLVNMWWFRLVYNISIIYVVTLEIIGLLHRISFLVLYIILLDTQSIKIHENS